MAQLYLDSDGVLKDPDQITMEMFGLPMGEAIETHKPKHFWRAAANYRQPGTGYGFFRALPLMSDAQELWDATRHLDPIILTGCPMGNWAPRQKVERAQEAFGADVRIITCMARDKVLHMENPGDVLVDDNTKFRDIWEAAGGVFVHHTSTAETLRQLRELYPEWFA